MDWLAFISTPVKDIPNEYIVDVYGNACVGVDHGIEKSSREDELREEIYRRLLLVKY